MASDAPFDHSNNGILESCEKSFNFSPPARLLPPKRVNSTIKY